MSRYKSNTTNRTAAVRHGWLVGAALLAVNAAIATIAAPAEAARGSCEATVTERLSRLNVEPSDILSISCVAERGGRIMGIKAWVSLRSCEGNLVFDMSQHGQVRQVYGRGACDLGGAVEIH